MKKTIFALFFVSILIVGVFGVIAQGAGGKERTFGDGVYVRNEELSKEKCNAEEKADGSCKKAETDDLFKKQDKAIKLQNEMDKTQAEGFNKKLLAEKLKIGEGQIGDNAAQMEWADDENSFTYKGAEYKIPDNPGEITKIEFTDDSIKLTKTALNKKLVSFEWGKGWGVRTPPKTPIQPTCNTAGCSTTPSNSPTPNPNKPPNNPFPASSRGQTAGNLQGRVGGGGGSQGGEGLSAAFQAASQALQMFAQYINPAKESIVASAQESNAKAQQNRMTTQGNMAGGIQRGNGETALAFQGGVEVEDEDHVTLDANTIAIADSGAGMYVGHDTYLTNQGSGLDAFTAITATAISFPLLNLIPKISLSIIPTVTAQITGNQISDTSGQYITFQQDDLDFNGREIEIYALKTFDEVKAGGQDLDFYSANFRIKFNQQRIYAKLPQQNAPFGANKIQNKLDPNTEFKLQHYTNKKGNFHDTENRVTITDITTKHPKKQLTIAKIRKDMWK